MPSDTHAETARTQGEKQARKVLTARNRVLATRRRAAGASVEAASIGLPKPVGVSAARQAAVVGLAGAPVLLAEGDSWFDYPWNDVLTMLEDEHGYDVEDVAKAGDRVEDMAYSDGQLDRFSRKLEKLLARGVVPRAILLSGGGNDVVGDEFGMLLNHALSPAPGLNTSVVSGIVDNRLRYAYITIISAITQICMTRLGRALRIVTHGYDYPVPDGRGFLGGWGPLPGPWLAPGFRAKGYAAMTRRKTICRELIDGVNAMLRGVSQLSGFGHVKHVDLRGTLVSGTTYRDWWANEIHPTKKGFSRVAKKIAAAL